MPERFGAPERLEADVLVVGAGPAGIAAACCAAEAGAETLLIDDNPAAGGQIWRRGVGTAPAEARPWLDRLSRSGARVEGGISVFDQPDERTLAAECRGKPLDLAWDRLVIATGARELFLPFPGWTLPGVLGIGAIQAMAKAGADLAGQRIVIAGSGPLILPVAATLAARGAKLEAVVEQASAADLRRFALGLWRWPAKIAQAVTLRWGFRATRYNKGTWVASAGGDDSLESVTLTDGSSSWPVDCELLAASYGLVPNTELARLLGCDTRSGAVVVTAEQMSSVDGVFCAGEVCSIGGVEAALSEGEIAGLVAAGREPAAPLVRRRDKQRRFARRLATTFTPRRELFDRIEPETLICRCEDVSSGRIDAAWEMRQAKLYRRVGMGPCQGRICGPVLELLHGWSPDSVRPPLKPVSAATLTRSSS